MSLLELKGQTLDELIDFSKYIGIPHFRGKQLFSWIYAKGVDKFDLMTNIGKDLKEKLKSKTKITSLKLIEHNISLDKNTEKFLFELPDQNFIESVLMRYKEQKNGRCTICISSQVGCAQGCAFCASGVKGFVRNLTAGEIVDQVIQIQNYLSKKGENIHNVVIMGIGEPLMNYDNLLKAIKLINHDCGIAIGIRRIAISTVGIPPLIMKFADEKIGIRFAVSLHAPDDEIRNKIMPINNKYPIPKLLQACKYYQDITGKRITFEYMLIKGLNDSLAHADKLSKLLKGLHSMINLIPLNPVKHFPYKTPSIQRCQAFANVLKNHGYNATLRNERGVNINAACGQLRLRKIDK